MTYRKNINIVNVAKEMAETFGYSNYFATLSLSLSLSKALIYNNLHIVKSRGYLLGIYGFPCKPTREAALFVVN